MYMMIGILKTRNGNYRVFGAEYGGNLHILSTHREVRSARDAYDRLRKHIADTPPPRVESVISNPEKALREVSEIIQQEYV